MTDGYVWRGDGIAPVASPVLDPDAVLDGFLVTVAEDEGGRQGEPEAAPDVEDLPYWCQGLDEVIIRDGKAAVGDFQGGGIGIGKAQIAIAIVVTEQDDHAVLELGDRSGGYAFDFEKGNRIGEDFVLLAATEKDPEQEYPETGPTDGFTAEQADQGGQKRWGAVWFHYSRMMAA